MSATPMSVFLPFNRRSSGPPSSPPSPRRSRRRSTSHVPMLSKPDVVLDVIREAASAVLAS